MREACKDECMKLGRFQQCLTKYDKNTCLKYLDNGTL